MEMRVRRQAEHKKIFGQQTPRRWGWGTPLKKRTATRIRKQSRNDRALVNLTFHLRDFESVPHRTEFAVATTIIGRTELQICWNTQK